jgi:hypothetical protein
VELRHSYVEMMFVRRGREAKVVGYGDGVGEGND